MLVVPQGGYVFENRIDFEIIEICLFTRHLYIFLGRENPDLVKEREQPAHPCSPIGAFVFSM